MKDEIPRYFRLKTFEERKAEDQHYYSQNHINAWFVYIFFTWKFDDKNKKNCDWNDRDVVANFVKEVIECSANQQWNGAENAQYKKFDDRGILHVLNNREAIYQVFA